MEEEWQNSIIESDRCLWKSETSETVPFLSVEVLETGKLLCIQSEGMDIQKKH